MRPCPMADLLGSRGGGEGLQTPSTTGCGTGVLYILGDPGGPCWGWGMQRRSSGWWEMFLQPPPAWWHFCPYCLCLSLPFPQPWCTHGCSQTLLSPSPALGARTGGPGADGIACRWLGSRSTTPSASAASTAAPSSGMGTPMRWWSAPSSTGTSALVGAGGTRALAPPPTLLLCSPQRPLLLPDGGDPGDRADPAGLAGLPHPSHRHPGVHPRLL